MTPVGSGSPMIPYRILFWFDPLAKIGSVAWMPEKFLYVDCGDHDFVSRSFMMSACPIVQRRDVEWRVPVADHLRQAIESLVSTQKTLEDVVRWGLGLKPVQMVKDVIIQDEYTHDVVLRHPSGVWLVYDVT